MASMWVKKETSRTDNGKFPPFETLAVDDVRLEFHPKDGFLEAVYIGDYILSYDGVTWALFHEGEMQGAPVFDSEGGLSECFRRLLAAMLAETADQD